MKKEPLSIMTVKTLLAVIIFTGLGTIIIGGAYLIGKQGVISLPHYQPSDKSECEVDADCKLVYVGGACTPCGSTLDEGYQCLPREEAMEIIRERQRILIDPEGPQCSMCPQPLEIQHICKCENGKCEKVKKELVEEVVITTDKMEYEQGEEITANLNYKGKIYQWDRFAWSIQKLENGLWIDIKRENDPKFSHVNMPNCKNINLNEIEECPAIILFEKAMWYEIKDAPKLIWKQFYKTEEKTFSCNFVQRNAVTKKVTSSKMENRSCAVFDKVQPGNYKIRFEYATDINIDDSFDRKIDIKYAESKFTIKEKSALDARCYEKVQLFGNCPAYFEEGGYEFDPETEKCIEKFVKGSGCGVKNPFYTLEECQEVCEKTNCAKAGEFANPENLKGKTNYPDNCCSGLKGLGGYGINDNGECEPLIGTPFLTCMPCGNGICEEINNFEENECNCPEDCGKI